jgi:DNA-binding CsgD family transcriptional regulator
VEDIKGAGDGNAGGAEPDEVRALRTMADTVREALVDAALMAHGDEIQRLVGTAAIVANLARLEPSARRTVWNMQPDLFYDPHDTSPELNEASQSRGVQTCLVTRPTTLLSNPVLSSMHPTLRTGPVFLRALVVDEARVLIEGLDTAEGEPTAWLTDRMDFVVPVLEVWHRTYELSTPVLGPGEAPPLSKRQLQVARLLATGEKDQSIARRLDMSARTVERDVRTILEVLGARSRTDAVLTMSGRGGTGSRRVRGFSPSG